MVRPSSQQSRPQKPQPQQSQQSDVTDFGYARVSMAEKTRRVQAVFKTVAPHYDRMNDAMSLGIHRLWKDALVREAAPRPGMAILDVAGGTGDVAQRLIRHQNQSYQSVLQPPLLICDLNPAMLNQGRDRLMDQGLTGMIQWVVGDGQSLPVADASIDLVTMAFGLRNITDKIQALKEAFRVLKTGGRFLCLEFSQPNHPWLKRAYDLYSFTALPTLGKIIAGEAAAYRYLAESIRMFPTPDHLANMMRQAGFRHVYHRLFSGGVVALHGGTRGQRLLKKHVKDYRKKGYRKKTR